jgi:DinB family protein
MNRPGDGVGVRPADIRLLEYHLEAAERDARALVEGLTEEQGTWCPSAGSWSVAQCLDHLATGNRVYLRAMVPAAARAREQRRERRGLATPGLVGRLFVRALEPPAKALFKMKAPRTIRPRTMPGLSDAFAAFMASQGDALAFVREHADLDLAGVRFPNPFIRGVRFSLATGLHVIAAHDRRHLWQAWRVRREAERAVPASQLRQE